MVNRHTKNAPGVVRIYLDVMDLDVSASFYEVLGFRQVGVYRQGLPYESRMLRGETRPGLMLVMRQSYRRPVVGSLPGGVTRLALHEPDLATRRAEIEKVVRLLPPSDRASPAEPAGAAPSGAPGYIEFLDPDGYLIELYA